MNILYAATVDLGLEKGDTIHFLHLARALKKRKHTLTMVATGQANHNRHIPEVTLHSIKNITVIPKIAPLLNDVRLLWTLFYLMLTQQFDVLYHRGIPLANYLGRLFGIPSIVEVNGIQVDELRAAGMREFGVRLYQRREAKIVNGASRVICVTAGIRDQLVARYGVDDRRCVIIPNAADTDIFRPQPKEICQQRVELRSEQYNIGFVGAFQPWIDFTTLLGAVEILRDQDIPICCILVGDGRIYQDIQQQVKAYGLIQSVKFVGRVSFEQVPDWIGAFEVCVAPFLKTRNERIGLSPLKLYEYMACGRPVVATSLSGIRETLERSEAGLLYEPGDRDGLAHCLVSLYDDTDLREKMGQRARAYALKHHSWDSVAIRTEALMEALLA